MPVKEDTCGRQLNDLHDMRLRTQGDWKDKGKSQLKYKCSLQNKLYPVQCNYKAFKTTWVKKGNYIYMNVTVLRDCHIESTRTSVNKPKIGAKGSSRSFACLQKVNRQRQNLTLICRQTNNTHILGIWPSQRQFMATDAAVMLVHESGSL